MAIIIYLNTGSSGDDSDFNSVTSSSDVPAPEQLDSSLNLNSVTSGSDVPASEQLDSSLNLNSESVTPMLLPSDSPTQNTDNPSSGVSVLENLYDSMSLDSGAAWSTPRIANIMDEYVDSIPQEIVGSGSNYMFHSFNPPFDIPDFFYIRDEISPFLIEPDNLLAFIPSLSQYPDGYTFLLGGGLYLSTAMMWGAGPESVCESVDWFAIYQMMDNNAMDRENLELIIVPDIPEEFY